MVGEPMLQQKSVWRGMFWGTSMANTRSSRVSSTSESQK